MKKLRKRAKETIALGVGSMAGMGVMGAMGSVPGMPAAANTITPIVGSGLGLLNIGQLIKNTQTLTDTLSIKTKAKKGKRRR